MQAQSHLLDIYRSMARAANDTVTATLQSTQRIQQNQLDVVKAALDQSTRSAQQLTQVQSIDELVSAHSQLVGTQVAHTMEIWRSMFRALGDTQMTLMAQMQSHVG